MFLWNVEKCLKIFSRTYVSSDDKWILSEAEEVGAIPIKRGEELCGDVPNIPVYQHASQFMNGFDGIVAVQANSPTVDSKLIQKVKRLMEMGFQEILTSHKDGSKYGSIWGLSFKRLKDYPDPYNPKPDIWIKDKSVDIDTLEDFNKALLQQNKNMVENL